MKFIHFDSIDSTSKYLLDHHNEYDNLTFVSASYQSKGKGREERIWNSEAHQNLLFSVLIKDEKVINNYRKISVATAGVIVKILMDLNMKNVQVKWPNDVYVNDQKICGILLQGQLPNFLVIGVGLNVNQRGFAGEFRKAPTSIYLELQQEILIENIKNKVYQELNKMFVDQDKYFDIAISYDYLKGKEFLYKDEKVLSLGIQKDGSLLIKKNNEQLLLRSGEIDL